MRRSRDLSKTKTQPICRTASPISRFGKRSFLFLCGQCGVQRNEQILWWRVLIVVVFAMLLIAFACRKRDVPQERIDQLVSGIQRQVETAGEVEIASQRIGEMVMDGLRGLDSVAYIRFASVYRDFSEARDFEEFASTVQEAAANERG